ncbi:MAG: RluA family pseudouridine synthase [Pseudomonadota bacterium]
MIDRHKMQTDLEANLVEQSFVITEEMSCVRLDALLFEKLRLAKPKYLKLITEGRIRLNGRVVLEGSPRPSAGSVIEILKETSHPEVLPENIPLNILHENDDCFVIDKPAGMAAHPGPRHCAGTIANALRALQRPLSFVEGSLRPGIVHRLDIGTSGVMVIAKHDASHIRLVNLFKKHAIHKEYLAIIRGVPEWDDYSLKTCLRPKSSKRKGYVVGEKGKEAQTLFTVVKRNKQLSVIVAKPITGRTHQIRVHLSHLGFPILGDTIYGGGSLAATIAARFLMHRPALHAMSLKCEELKLDVHAPIPADMLAVLEDTKS